MGDESISFFKMNFNQKVQVATQRLQAQGKEATTANIVKEMVSMANAEKTNGDTPVQGYAIEHADGVAAARRTGDVGDIVIDVYGSPNIPGGDIPQDITKFLDFIMELLPLLDNLPPQVTDDLIEVLTEYLVLLQKPDIIDSTEVLYGTPNILDDEVTKKLAELFKVMNDLGIDQDVMSQIAQKFIELKSGSISAEEFEVELDNIIASAGLNEEQASKIKEFFLNSIAGEVPEELYGTPQPVDPNSPLAQNLEKLHDFINKLQDMGLPSDLVSDILQELANAMKNEETDSYVEVLDRITAKIKEANLSDEQEAELMNALSDLLNEINNDVVSSVCLYGSPNIPSFKEIITKFLPDVSGLSQEWRGALAAVVEAIISFLSVKSGTEVAEVKTDSADKNNVKPIVKTLASGKKILVIPRYDNDGNITSYVDLSGRTYEKNLFKE